MSIVSVTKVFDERIVRDDTGISIQENYRVEFSSLTDDFASCLTAVDPVTSLAVPNAAATRSVTINDTGTPSTGTIPVKRIEPTRDANKLVAIVMVQFAGTGGGYGLGGGGPVTTAGSWNVSLTVKAAPVEVQQSQGYMFNTGNITQIVNSASEPVDPGLPTTKHDREITITWNTRNPPIEGVKVCADYINNSDVTFTFNGQTIACEQYHLKLVDYDFSGDKSTSDLNVWKCRMTFYERLEAGGWIRKFIDEGKYYLDSNGTHQPAPNGQKVYLDHSGGQLPGGDPPPPPFVNTVRLEEATNFAPLFAYV